MAASASRFVFLAVGMIITGSLNTLTTKLADVTDSEGIDGDSREFDHPFVQALGMFLGEFLCILAFQYGLWRERQEGKVVERKKFSPIVFLGPACCDLTATSLMYLGLTMTYASVFQMLRGSVVIFTGIFSVVFLGRKLNRSHWFGMLLVLGGLACVGAASLGGGGKNAKNPLLGNVFVIAAQLIVACQMVLEEKYVTKYDVAPLLAVGWEGTFGFCLMSCLLILFYYIPGQSVGGRLENAPDAFFQLGNSWIVLVATLGNVMSIAFFNYFGISVTKEMSATTRTMLDSVRTFIIWGISLLVKWQDFAYLQVIGFAILLFGTCVYQGIIVLPCLPPPPKQEPATTAAEEGPESHLLGNSDGASDAETGKHIQQANGDGDGGRAEHHVSVSQQVSVEGAQKKWVQENPFVRQDRESTTGQRQN